MHPSEYFITEAANPVTINILSWDEFNNYKLQLNPITQNTLSCHNFSGKAGERVFVYDHNGSLLEVFLGAGDKKKHHILADAITGLPEAHYRLANQVTYLEALYWGMAQYQFTKYKHSKTGIKKLFINQHLLDDIVIELTVIFQVRDLINEPANIMTPSNLAHQVENLAALYDADFNEWIGNELLQANFPAIFTVGQAACDLPRLATLTWGETHHPLLVLIGKGVCFDSGGLDIKSAQAMRLMKKDMGGAANAIGLAHWIMAKKLPIRLLLLIPAVENAVGSRSYRPGDIIKMRNGMTVEIDNTDAEGRLILADCLTYATEHNPKWVIDLSTLTGAARIAVGTEIAAFFTHDFNLAHKLVQIGDSIDDYVWPLPLFSGYNDMLRSNIADCVNSSSASYAGATTAALFLEKFVSKNYEWLHFDFMAWNVSAKSGRPEGGEAMAIRTILHYLLMLS